MTSAPSISKVSSSGKQAFATFRSIRSGESVERLFRKLLCTHSSAGRYTSPMHVYGMLTIISKNSGFRLNMCVSRDVFGNAWSVYVTGPETLRLVWDGKGQCG